MHWGIYRCCFLPIASIKNMRLVLLSSARLFGRCCSSGVRGSRAAAFSTSAPTAKASSPAREASFLTQKITNSGSAARDHLANERTFLAWARTGLAFLGAGTGVFLSYELGTRQSEDSPLPCDKGSKSAADSLRSHILPACMVSERTA